MKQERWHAVLILLILIVALSIYQQTANMGLHNTPHFAPNMSNAQTDQSTIFSDNFASYPAGSANSASNPCNAPPDHTAVCQSPPLEGSASGFHYWQPASSGTCVKRGGCVTWQNMDQMGPNSVFSIVNEQTMPDTTKSLKEGASDWTADKTSAGVYDTPNVPSNSPLTLQFSVWFSPGVENLMTQNGYGNQFYISVGAGKIVYFGAVEGYGYGYWQIQDAPQSQLSFATLGQDRLTTQAWHTISVTWNPVSNTWVSLIIDGVQPFSQVNGYPIYGQGGPTSAVGTFELFIDPGGDYQSITSAPTQGQGWTGYYAYLDDVSLYAGQATGSTSLSGSSTASSLSSTPTVSSSSASVTSGQVVWSANFETGDNSQFNNGQQSTCTNGVIGVSSTIVHSGNYAGYYSGQMPSPPPSEGDCREYPQEALPFSLTDFHWEGWFYVPTQTQTDWVSFATFNYITSSNPSISSLPFTIDAAKNTNILHLTITWPTQFIYVYSTVAYPFNTWFELSLDAHSVNTAQGSITIYLNDAPIIQYQGQLLEGPLTNVHFGAYLGSGQPSWTVYNDDILIETLSGGTGTSTSSTVTTGVSTSTQTSTATSGLTSTVTTVLTTQSPVTSTVTSTVTTGDSTSTQISTVTSSMNSTVITVVTSVVTSIISTNTLTLTQTETLTSSQSFATTTTVTVTGPSSQVSYSYTTVTVTGDSTSSAATTSTAILLTTSSVMTTVTQTAVTTSNILGVHAESPPPSTNYPDDALGLFGTLFLLAMALGRRILG